MHTYGVAINMFCIFLWHDKKSIRNIEVALVGCLVNLNDVVYKIGSTAFLH